MIVFDRMPSSMQERWHMIHKLIEKWHGIKLEWKESDHREKIQALEKDAGVTLSPSVKEWICMIEEMIRTEQWLIRDSYDISFRHDWQALTLLIQGEEDYYWAVKKENLGNEDPTVEGYGLWDDGVDLVFRWDKQVSSSVTSFTIKYFLDYLDGAGGYTATVQDKDNTIKEFTEQFPHHITIDDYTIFESANALALIENTGTPDQALLSVHYQGEMRQLPDCIKSRFRYAGSYYGKRMS